MSSLQQQVQDAQNLIDTLSEAVQPEVLLDDKVIADALEEQIRLQLRWERIVAECRSLVTECEIFSEEMLSRAIERIRKSSYTNMSSTELKIAAAADQQYIDAKKLENKMVRSKDIAAGVLRTIETRKYVLNNQTKLIVDGSEKNIL